jgi:PAS domain S-box-containing protein
MKNRPNASGPVPLGRPNPLAPVAARTGAERLPWTYFLLFFLGTALVMIATWYHVEGQRQSIRAQWRAQISEVARDRARLIENWLVSRRADADVLAASPLVRSLLASPGRGDEALTRHLDRVAAAYGYTSISISDPDGRPLAHSTGAPEMGADNRDVAATVARTRTRKSRIELTEARAGQRLLTISVPALGEGSAGVLGVVTLRMKPESGLFVLVTDETSTRTGETLLLRLEGPDAAYLSPLRQEPAGWAAVNRSLEALRDLARTAGDSRAAFGEVTDYRAVPVFAAIRGLGLTGWVLALKVDRDEAMAEFARTGQLTGAVAAALLLAFAGFLVSFWRQQQRARLLRAQVEQERALSNLQGYAEKIVASVPAGLLLLSADLRILSVNPSFLESFRLREEHVQGHVLPDVMRSEGLMQRAREVLASGVAQRDVLLDLRLVARQEARPALVTLTGIRMTGGEPARLLLIIQDLTEEERLQAARRESEERFRSLVQGLDAIVWEADTPTLRFSFVSQRAESILGHPVSRWLETPDFFVTRIHPDDRDRVMEACRGAIAQGRDHELEYRARTADGREVWLRDIVHVISGADGRAAQLRGLTVDLTGRKRAEEALRQAEDQLRQAQKMDAVGKLAGGIAHDFNNLLMVIRGDGALILQRFPANDPLRQNAEAICEAADQAATLTRQLLAFSRKQVIAPAVVDLNAVVAGMRKMLRRLIGETIDLVTLTASDLGRVTADPGQLEQMILNLAVNARDAMPDGGRLTIRTSNTEVDAETARHRGVKSGPYVVLEVSDTGTGMDAETQSHLFEPFFTTKDQDKGTGLGLSTVYGIVNQSGGHIAVDSAPGQGTALRVYLARIEEVVPRLAPVPGAPSPAVATAGPGRQEVTPVAAGRDGTTTRPARETVLLVEDAKRVREVVREILEINGYAVLEAGEGAEAVTVSSRYPGPIDLLVTDVVMPQMSGRELAQRLAPLRPDMRILYMSGYTDDDIVRHGVLEAGMAFISKPFTPDALAIKLREVLDAPPKGSPAAHPDALAPTPPGPVAAASLSSRRQLARNPPAPGH